LQRAVREREGTAFELLPPLHRRADEGRRVGAAAEQRQQGIDLIKLFAAVILKMFVIS
jgi:hypothetical protein